MQNIAKENNLSETAFTVKKGNEYELRWFTPGGEIDLSVILSVCLALCGLFLLTAESGITGICGHCNDFFVRIIIRSCKGYAKIPRKPCRGNL